MNKLITKTVLALVATTAGATALVITGAGAGAGAASLHAATGTTTTTTLGPPAQGAGRHAIFMYVDTVAGGNYKPVSDCTMTNLFQPGQTVVFRMDGVNVAAGGVNLTAANVASAWITIPGVKAQTMSYGTHGKFSYWTTGWAIPTNYPVGTVNFVVHVITKAVPATASSSAVPAESGTFTQAGLAPPSQLTIVKA